VRWDMEEREEKRCRASELSLQMLGGAAGSWIIAGNRGLAWTTTTTMMMRDRSGLGRSVGRNIPFELVG